MRRDEHGQTILLVAVSIVALLSMAALAIDVVTLYVAKSEIQRAADAAALIGAKAIVDSGVTTVPATDTTNLPLAETLAANMATTAITGMLTASAANANLVAGQAPALNGVPNLDFTTHGNNNPTITVTLQQNSLPTFFARVFSRTSATTKATATAEVYNPANMQDFTPIATQCVKPWLMANGDPTTQPTNGQPLNEIIDPPTGNIKPNLANFIGQSFYLHANCNPGRRRGNCTLTADSPPHYGELQAGNGYNAVYYVPAAAGTTNIMPSCAVGLSPYSQSIAGCDTTVYSCGGSAANSFWDVSENPAKGTTPGSGNTDQFSDTALGAECLLHLPTPGSTGPGLGQDELTYISPWPNDPARITSPIQGNVVVSTSNSIVTIPIIAAQRLFNTPPVTVIGFLQAFVNSVGYLGPGPADYGDINITVLNVVGCSQTPNGNAPVIGGNGASTIPVRLITPP
jgi:Flp pilus assembly protein TadG